MWADDKATGKMVCQPELHFPSSLNETAELSTWYRAGISPCLPNWVACTSWPYGMEGEERRSPYLDSPCFSCLVMCWTWSRCSCWSLLPPRLPCRFVLVLSSVPACRWRTAEAWEAVWWAQRAQALEPVRLGFICGLSYLVPGVPWMHAEPFLFFLFLSFLSSLSFFLNSWFPDDILPNIKLTLRLFLWLVDECWTFLYLRLLICKMIIILVIKVILVASDKKPTLGF